MLVLSKLCATFTSLILTNASATSRRVALGEPAPDLRTRTGTGEEALDRTAEHTGGGASPQDDVLMRSLYLRNKPTLFEDEPV